MSTWYQTFHTMIQGIQTHSTKAAFEQNLLAVPLNLMVEMSFRVQYNAKKHSKYLRLPYSRTYDDCILSREQYLHEMMTQNTKAKLFFDLDLPGVIMTEEEKDLFLLSFYNFLVQYFVIEGFHIEPDQFIVLESIHTKDAKTSFHIVINNGCHFQDAKHVGLAVNSLLGKVLNDDRELRLTHEFKCDSGPYSSGLLRCIGGSNWNDSRSILFLRGWFELTDRNDPTSIHFVKGPELANLTFNQYKLCFVQYVLDSSRLIGSNNREGNREENRSIDQSERAVERQRQRNEGRFDIESIDDEEHKIHLRFILEEVRKIRGNHEAIYQMCLYSEEYRCYDVAFDLCHQCQYDATPIGYNRLCMRARLILDEEVAYLECNRICRCQGKESIIYLSAIAKQRADFINISLPLLSELDKDRPDMPITEDEFGRRCIDKNDLPQLRKFVYHPIRQDTGLSWDLKIWKQLRKTKNFKGMVTYLNCFVTFNSQKKMYIVRSPLGYQTYNTGKDATVLCASLMYDEPAPTKDDAEATKEKPFMKPWNENKYGIRRVFARGRMGPFKMFGTVANELMYDFNLLPPPKINVIEALRIYRIVSENAPATIQMLRAMWDVNLDFVVMKEDEVRRYICRDYFERWYLTKLFDVGKKNNVNVFLASEGGGTGKSFNGELIIYILGEDHAMICRNLETYNGRFLTSGNKCFVLFDEAIGDANKKTTQSLFKALTTAPYFTSANKGGEEFETQKAIMDFMFTCNPEIAAVFIPGISQSFDRRNFAQELPR